jgi:lipopolysaccharide transport system permease protein
VLEPLLFVATFYLVFVVILGTNREDYLALLMCGLLPYNWFSKSITHSARSIIANVGMIGNIDLPKTMFPMALVQEGVYKQAIVFSLLLLFLMSLGYSPSLAWFWLVPVILVNYLMIVSFALIASVLVCFFKDINMFIPLGLLFLMFSSGVFFDLETVPNPETAQIILTYNPMAFLLHAYRQVLMHKVTPDLVHLAQIGLIFSATTGITVAWMRKNSRLLALKAFTA